MADIEKVIKGLTQCTSVNTQTKCHACPYWGSKDGFSDCDGMKADALELLKEPRKTKDEILFAIVSAIGYKSVDAFKETAEEVGSLDEFMIGMNRSINAVEKLFAKDGEQE